MSKLGCLYGDRPPMQLNISGMRVMDIVQENPPLVILLFLALSSDIFLYFSCFDPSVRCFSHRYGICCCFSVCLYLICVRSSLAQDKRRCDRLRRCPLLGQLPRTSYAARRRKTGRKGTARRGPRRPFWTRACRSISVVRGCWRSAPPMGSGSALDLIGRFSRCA